MQHCSLLKISVFRLAGSVHSDSDSDRSFERLLIIIRLLNFSEFSYGLRLNYDLQVALVDCVKTRRIRSLEFRGCTIDSEAWSPLIDASHSRLQRLACIDTGLRKHCTSER